MTHTPEDRKAAELFRDAYEKANPRQPDETAFAYYARGILWLQTVDGKAAFVKAAQDAKE